MRAHKFVFVHKGVGGFLNPPGHAEHTLSVREKYSNGRECGSMSLSCAATEEWVPAPTRATAKMYLKKYPGEYTDAWERVVYSYFAHCYSPDGVRRGVSDMVVESTGKLPAEHSLAYLFVKSFFPEAKPRLDLIANPPNDYGKQETNVAEHSSAKEDLCTPI